MRHHPTILLFLLCCILLCCRWNALAAAPTGEFHKACTECHKENNELIYPNVNDLCYSCHPNNMTDHKIGVAPPVEPAGLPLSETGTITCITCHEPHGKTTYANLLRAEKDKICLKCHDK